jgi:glycosyltransferase involved in cell wall biosynthesis
LQLTVLCESISKVSFLAVSDISKYSKLHATLAMKVDVSDKLIRLLFNISPGKRPMGRALLNTLQKIENKHKLKAAVDSLPKVLASHPAIVAFRNAHFVKETSSGRDLVISCGNTAHPWNPETLKAQGKGFVGGSEEAVIYLSRELAKLGWNVTVYNNCGNKPTRDVVACHNHNGVMLHHVVTYRPFWERNFSDKQDVVILWRYPRPLDMPINAPKVFLDLHDAVQEDQFTPTRLQRLTKILVKTQFHRSLLPNVPDSKIAIIPNGMDLSLLESNPPIDRDPYLITNTSSPDRSMDVLPELFKEVKKFIPQARLQWAHGWDSFYRASRYETKERKKKLTWMKQTQREMDEAGIETLGRLTQAEVGKLYQRASILAYPTECQEIDCISVKKAQAAGCLPVVTNVGALAESAPFGWRVPTRTRDTGNRPCRFHFGLEDRYSQQEWVDLCVKALRSGGMPEGRAEMKKWSRQFEWHKIAARWNDILTASK